MKKKYPDSVGPIYIPPKEEYDWLILKIVLPIYLRIPGYLRLPALRLFGRIGNRFR